MTQEPKRLTWWKIRATEIHDVVLEVQAEPDSLHLASAQELMDKAQPHDYFVIEDDVIDREVTEVTEIEELS
jgi:hypothetical protein